MGESVPLGLALNISLSFAMKSSCGE